VGQKSELVEQLEAEPYKNGLYYIGLSKSYKVKKIWKACKELDIVMLRDEQSGDDDRGCYPLRRISYDRSKFMKLFMVMRKDDYEVWLNDRATVCNLMRAMESKRYIPYKKNFNFTGVWEKVTSYPNIYGETDKLPKYLFFYEKMGVPFFKVSFDSDSSTSKLKHSATLTPSPSRSIKNKWGVTQSLSFEEYHFWAIDRGYLTLGSRRLIRLGDENVYKRIRYTEDYIDIFNLHNITDINKQTYIRTNEGCLVLNVFEMIDIVASWDGDIENEYCTGVGKLSYNSKLEVFPPYFEGTLETGIPIGYGCIKFSDNTIWNCGDYVDGKIE
jgi:hypothetical protein